MKIAKDEILHIASLAKMNIAEEEIEKLSHDMESMIGFANTLNELDTTDISPTFHVMEMSNAFREDEISVSCHRAEILKNAPVYDEEGFVVPRVVD